MSGFPTSEQDSHGSAMSSLMIGTTSTLLDKLRGVSTSVNTILVPVVKLKSRFGKAACKWQRV